MNTRQLTRPETEPQPNRTADRTRPTEIETDVRADPRTATDRAPQTFSHRNTARLENLIDEFNAAFAEQAAESARGS